MIEDLEDLYGLSISEKDSRLEYLSTKYQNTAMNYSSTAKQQILSQFSVI